MLKVTKGKVKVAKCFLKVINSKQLAKAKSSRMVAKN